LLVFWERGWGRCRYAPSPWKQATKAAGKLTVVTLQYGCVTLRHVDVAATYEINVSHVLYVKKIHYDMPHYRHAT